MSEPAKFQEPYDLRDSGPERLTTESLEACQSFRRLVHTYLSIQTKLELPLSPPSRDIYGVFLQAPSNIQNSINAALEADIELLFEWLENQDRFRPHASLSQELEFLKRALFKKKLYLGDRSALDLIAEGDVIEVFDARGVQIFRSWSYFQYCSYSLADLMVFDWNELFMRPSWVVSQLLEVTSQVFRPGAQTIISNIPEYLLTERRAKSNRSLSLRMKFFSPLLDQTTGEPGAVLCVSRVTVLPDVQIGTNIQLI